MGPRPIHHLARVVSAAIIDATREGIGDGVGERRGAGDGKRGVAANGPLEAVIVRVSGRGGAGVGHALVVVGGAEVLVVERAIRGAVDVDTAVEPVHGGGGVPAKIPFGGAVAGVAGGGGRVLIGDSDAVVEERAVFEAIFEALGVCVVVGGHGFHVQVAPDIVRVSEVIGVFGVVTDIIGRLNTGRSRRVDGWLGTAVTC